LSYQWFAGGTNAGTGPEYTVTVNDLYKTIMLEITSSEETGTVSSAATSAVVKKAAPPAPEAPALESKTHNSVTLVEDAGYQYSKDGMNWQTSNIFEDLPAGTLYAFYQRIAETDSVFPSETSPVLNVRTDGTVTVTGGTASIYSGVEGTVVTLTPGEAQDGMQFKEWEVTSGNVTIKDSTFIIGDDNVVIKAVLEKIYNVSVKGGTASTYTSAEGKEVTLTPEKAPKGLKFKEWKVIFGNVTIKDNKFVIGTSDIDMEAVWDEAEGDVTIIMIIIMITTAILAAIILWYLLRDQGEE
jgi:hypothetical protein